MQIHVFKSGFFVLTTIVFLVLVYVTALHKDGCTSEEKSKNRYSFNDVLCSLPQTLGIHTSVYGESKSDSKVGRTLIPQFFFNK